MTNLRTWIEIDSAALRHNAEQFLKLIPKETRLMAVIKSNAYGHGLQLIAKLLASTKLQAPNHKPLWFGVDSIVEALPLRRRGIRNPILVLGSTLTNRLPEAAAQDIAVTISNLEQLAQLAKLRRRPAFHIKIDTGMHRQGFLPQEVPEILKYLKSFTLAPGGVYTHLAASKRNDPRHHVYTRNQLQRFRTVREQFQVPKFKNLIHHAAATAGTLYWPAHFDMVRIGMGLYGYEPVESRKRPLHPRSEASDAQNKLKPVLTWKTVISEIKEIPRGSYIGYDMTERVGRQTKIAVLPIGYWHGYDRGLSSIGEVLIRGRRAKVLGRVSMDMTVVDVTDIPHAAVGDEVVLIGQQHKETIWADELAKRIGTTEYEFLTRLNPLIRRTLA